MRMSQHVYFTIRSETVTAADVTAALGNEPDRIEVRGSKQTNPRPRPFSHSWSLGCANTSQPLDDQVASVLERIAPVASAVGRLVDEQNVVAKLVFVRYFNDEDGEDESLDSTTTLDGLNFEKLEGQHQLLGWALDVEQIALLARMRASIDADEYG
jgi:hypothetical protein